MDLWWNPVHSAIVFAIALVLGLVLAWLLLTLVRAGATAAHRAPYHKDQRMTAAVHYSTAWCVPVALAALIMALRPAAFAAEIARWTWCPTERAFIITGAVLAGFGAIMWWFWLVRLGATAPVRTQGRVVAFFTLGVPLMTAAAAAAWWYGQDRLCQPLFDVLKLSF